MTVTSLIAALLLAAGVLIALPALIALAGPDHEDKGRVSPGWLRNERGEGSPHDSR